LLALEHYDWPYNVRELESCIKRGVALTDGRPLDAPQLPDAIVEFMKGYGERRRNMEPSVLPPPPVGLPGAGAVALPGSPGSPGGANVDPNARRSAPTESELRELLVRHRGNVAAVGRELGKERMQIHRWLKRYNIDLEQYREE